MSFDPEEWMKVADVCCIHIPDVSREALLRTALNRAYYSALMTVKARIESAQGRGTVPTRGTHEAITQAVRTGGTAFEQISLTISNLRTLRELADYELNAIPLDWGRVQKAVTTARWLIRNRIKPMPAAEFRRLRVPRG